MKSKTKLKIQLKKKLKTKLQLTLNMKFVFLIVEALWTMKNNEEEMCKDLLCMLSVHSSVFFKNDVIAILCYSKFNHFWSEMGNDNYNPNWITLLIDNYFEYL